jgi:dipeptidyl aminopeptidase/acylaminoacyl peptidase
VARKKTLADYGLPYPDEQGLRKWKQLSLAMNASTITTPLLIQSPEQEAMVSLEAFKALKHYGVPMEWYVYPGEGHMKFQPRNKYFVYQRNLDWMNFWLQDKEDPNPGKQEQYKRRRAMREEFQKRRPATRP